MSFGGTVPVSPPTSGSTNRGSRGEMGRPSGKPAIRFGTLYNGWNGDDKTYDVGSPAPVLGRCFHEVGA